MSSKAVTLLVCGCGKALDRHSWKPVRKLDEFITKKVLAALGLKAKVSIRDFAPPKAFKEKQEGTAIVKPAGRPLEQKFVVKMSKCNLCVRQGTNYFEAALQLRCNNPETLEKGLQYVYERVAGLRQRGLFVNKVEKLDNGFDFFTTSNKLTHVLGRDIQESFGGKIKVSPRLFSKNHLSSKDIYRVNVFVELPEFARGDFIIYKDKAWLVEKVSKRIKLVELLGGSSEYVDYGRLDYKLLERQSAFVSKTYPHLEVINPHDYQSSMVKNKPRHSYSVGEPVRVVIHKGIYVVA